MQEQLILSFHAPIQALAHLFRDDFMFSYAAKVLHNLSKASFRDTKACSTLRHVSVLAEILKDASSPFLHAWRSKSRGEEHGKVNSTDTQMQMPDGYQPFKLIPLNTLSPSLLHT